MWKQSWIRCGQVSPRISIHLFTHVVTVLLKNEKNSEHPSKAKPNFVVDSLDNLMSLLQSTFTVESEE